MSALTSQTIKWVVSSDCKSTDCQGVPTYSQSSSPDFHSMNQPFKLSYLQGSVAGNVAMDNASLGQYEISSQIFGEFAAICSPLISHTLSPIIQLSPIRPKASVCQTQLRLVSWAFRSPRRHPYLPQRVELYSRIYSQAWMTTSDSLPTNSDASPIKTKLKFRTRAHSPLSRIRHLLRLHSWTR